MALALGTSPTDLRVGSASISRMAKGSTAFWDADAADYVSRVQAADGEALELGIVAAYHAFCLGCKDDGLWDAIQACCVMAGARTVAGALVPLKGDAPTAYPQPVNFVSGDYSRSLGLKGDGSTKYINSNFNDGSVALDDIHESVYVSSFPALSNTRYAGTSAASSGTQLQHFASRHFVYNRSLSSYTDTGSRSLGFFATNRQSSADYQIRQGDATTTASLASSGPVGGQDVHVFAYNGGGTASSHTDARLSFYSLGSSLDLALLDTRVSALMSAIGEAL